MLQTLATRQDKAALKGVLKLCDSNEQSVRVAALLALAKLGNASNIELLAERAATAKDQEQHAAVKLKFFDIQFDGGIRRGCCRTDICSADGNQ